MLDFLPYPIKKFVLENSQNLCELRVRRGQPILALFLNENRYIYYKNEKVIASAELIENMLLLACKNSIYAYNESIKNGYIPCGQGIRIGLGGECVYSGESVQTIKNFTSLCIRFPHEVIGVSDKALDIINDDYSVKSCLIISPPCVGKTLHLGVM